MPDGAVIYIVDDDKDIRDSTSLMLEGYGYRCAVYATAGEFLSANPHPQEGCLLLDVRLPGSDGLSLQSELLKRGITIPVVFFTGFGDVIHAVRAMKAGAVDFIQKPCPPHVFLEAIDRALSRARSDRRAAHELATAQQRIARLSPREYDVMQRLVAGDANKAIARKLGISTRTVEIHRARIMDKMEAGSLAELVRLALAATLDQSV
jgi:two-component system response regulator FixJ